LACEALADEQVEVARSESFADLMDLVRRTTKDVPRFGPLAVYDASLRIGAYVGVYPRRVYLHSGARDGCNAIPGIDCSGDTVDLDQLPPRILKLRAWEIEDFLCIYKDELKLLYRA